MGVLLMTGFEPFGGDRANASWDAVKQLDGVHVGGATIRSVCVPTVFGSADHVLAAAIRRFQPIAVIMVGEAGGRAAISLETRAVNRAHALIADNAGRTLRNESLRGAGPRFHGSTLPLRAIERDIRAAGIPVHLSGSAGTFVCNALFYGAGELRTRFHPGLPIGFIHVPVTPERAGRSGQSMAPELVVEALRVAAATTVRMSRPRARRRAA